ncbi:COP9 signalosome complex subunit 7b-like isoform X2 [Salvelinus namaycush]|uniref:COP9 signalosome complex subunit 7b-like isoform X2 n=1 Tax=Salvelinus namaycush TaxID=8040 RepID=A0A8U0QWU4_SALNM|nr:COP9 signalosome complex subunit 7b-like isoform X2 [Salvelinus namaycush]XP_038850081.1 COP9 signalosome complex subunit 7b-like isoform X2 [Salvelinus namaycush]XP_038850087.1 COP9 signalosome complex subunit 7b-like isoform X2 [Salvelinus namaycush]
MSSDVLLCCQTCADRGTERFGGQAINLSLLTNKMEVEQLLSLSGPALAQAISSLLETPGLYVFSDILELPNVRELETGPHAPVFQLLNLFAYGTYCDYKERAASLPELTPAQRNKLRHLSIISLASNLKSESPWTCGCSSPSVPQPSSSSSSSSSLSSSSDATDSG